MQDIKEARKSQQNLITNSKKLSSWLYENDQGKRSLLGSQVLLLKRNSSYVLLLLSCWKIAMIKIRQLNFLLSLCVLPLNNSNRHQQNILLCEFNSWLFYYKIISVVNCFSLFGEKYSLLTKLVKIKCFFKSWNRAKSKKINIQMFSLLAKTDVSL